MMAKSEPTTTRREALRQGGIAAVTVAAGLTLPATLAADDSKLRGLYETWARLRVEVERAFKVSSDLEPEGPDFPQKLSYTARTGKILSSGNDRPLLEQEIRAWFIVGDTRKRLLKLRAEYDYQDKIIEAMSGYIEAEARAMALHDEQTRVFVAICREPARTLEGLTFKIKVAEEYVALGKADTDPETGYLNHAALASVFKDADRLSGRAI